MNNLEKFIADNNITIESSPVASNPFMGKDMFHYEVTLRMNGKTLIVPFSMGAAHIQVKANPPRVFFSGVTYSDMKKVRESIGSWYYDFDRKEYLKRGRTSMMEAELAKASFEPKPPTIADVLYSLIIDASVMDYDGFEDWCSSFGYDSDSIKAKKIFYACIENYLKLKSFIGKTAFEKLQEMDLEEEAD